MPEDVGWTLREATRRTVDPDLLKECLSAQRRWRDAGAPTRFIRHFGLAHGSGASEENRQNRGRQALRNAYLTASAVVAEALRAYLISGQLVAHGRRGGPLAESISIPTSAWKVLKFKSFRRSIVAEPAPNKTQIYDVRIAPTLYAPDVVTRLDDEPLVRAFDRFVFNDPQAASLRKRAIGCGGNPRMVGFQSRLYHAYWYVDHGIAPEDDSIGFLLDGDDLPLARAADEVVRRRFRRIIQLLVEGALVAEGALNGQGSAVKISRAMWLRKGAVLDLYKGDFYDRYPDPGGEGEERVPPLYLSLMLRRSNAEASEKLHVKPIDDGGVRPAAAAFGAKPPGKGIRGAADQQRIEDECRGWLADLMRKSPGKRTATNGQLLAAAQKKWPISERSFSTARKLAIAETGAHAWRVAGATPKSPQPNRRGD